MGYGDSKETASSVTKYIGLAQQMLYGYTRASWFLFGLIQWRIWGDLLFPLPKYFRLGLAILIAVCGGYIGTSLFQISRACATFPLYVAGQVFPWEEANARLPWSVANAALGGLILLIIFAAALSDAVT